MTSTIDELATEAYGWFETRYRDDGDRFVALKDGAPDWVECLVHDAHGSFLPDDWRYESIRSAVGHIADSGTESENDLDDAGGEWADSNVDIYTAKRFQWLASNLERQYYCDEAIAEFGEFEDTCSLVGMGQYMESREVWAAVVRALADELEAREEDADTDD